jgi:hypothetical protein
VASSLSSEASRRQPVAKLDIRFPWVEAQPRTPHHAAHAIGGGAGDASQGSNLRAQVQAGASAGVRLVAVAELGDAVYCARRRKC